LAETHTQLIVAQRLDYLTAAEIEQIETEIGEVARLLHGLIRKLETTNHEPPTTNS
jgi:four helix bundle protein